MSNISSVTTKDSSGSLGGAPSHRNIRGARKWLLRVGIHIHEIRLKRTRQFCQMLTP